MKKHIGLMVCMVMGLSGLARAATISWSSEAAATDGAWGQNLSPGLFDTNGAPVYAENMGGDAYTFDGINFSAGTTVFAGGITNIFHDDPASWESELTAPGTFSSSGASTVTLTGLSIGTNYVVQALLFDGRGDDGVPGRTVEFNGIDQGQYASGVKDVTWGQGLLVTGSFTADATNQSFTIEVFSGNSVSMGSLLNALTVFDPNGTPPPPPPNATITWSSAPAAVTDDILVPGLFNTNGTLVLAENVGGSATSFDGIDFSDGTVVFSGAFDGFGPVSGPDIVRTGTYGDAAPNTVSISGLVSNKEYRVEALIYDGRGTATITGRNVELDGEDQGVYANGVDGVSWGPGLLVTGTFTAVGPEQAFTIEAFIEGMSKGGQLNALTVYAVSQSEPVTVMIAGPINGGTAMEISWVGLAGEAYSVETNSALIGAGGWSSIAAGLQGTGSTTTITNTIIGDETYYRVITE